MKQSMKVLLCILNTITDEFQLNKGQAYSLVEAP